MVDLPMDNSGMVQGLGYVMPEAPTTDVMPTVSGDTTIPGNPNTLPSPTVSVSLGVQSEDAPGNGQTWNSGDKGTDWMGGSSLPWEK